MPSALSLRVFLAAAAILWSAGRLAAQSATAPIDWPQWRGAARDGRVPSLPRTMPSPKLVWKQPVAGACDAGIAVARGLVFVADHDEKNDYYRCLDAEKGTEIWSRSFPNAREMEYGPAPRATPLVTQGTAITQSAFGELYCFDLKTGKTVWQRDFIKDFGLPKWPTWGYSSSPLVAGGKLIVNPGGKTSLAALDPETGKLIWAGEGGRANYSSFLVGTFGGVEQVVGHDADSLGGWDLATGKRLWSIPMEQGNGYIVPTPINVGGKLFVCDQTNEAQLFQFGKDGAIVETPVAKSEEIAPEVITPVLADGLIIGVTKKLVCLDAVNGLATLWTESDTMFKKCDWHVILAKDVGLAMSNYGEMAMFSFDRQGVKMLGKTKLCKRTLMHPTLVGSRLFVRDAESLYCYDLGS